MKINQLSLILLIGIFAISCSSDHDGPSPVQSVAGNYKGYTIMDSGYFKDRITQNETINIIDNEDGTATVNFTSSDLGTTTISAATVTATTNGYSITGTGISAMGMSGTTSNYECKLAGTISTDKSDVEIIFTLPKEVMQGTTITFLLGDAPDNLVVAGSYNSYSSAISSLHGPVGVFNGESIALKANTENGKVDFTYSGQWGEAAITDLKVSKKDGSYTVSGSGITAITGHGGTGNYEFTVEGTISADKTTASFVMTIEMGEWAQLQSQPI